MFNRHKCEFLETGFKKIRFCAASTLCPQQLVHFFLYANEDNEVPTSQGCCEYKQHGEGQVLPIAGKHKK